MHNTEIVNVATSVDKQRGLFLIRNSSEGSVAYPIHVRKVLKEALWIVDVAVVFVVFQPARYGGCFLGNLFGKRGE